MKTLRKRAREARRGWALFVGAIVTFVGVALTSVMLTTGTATNRVADVRRASNEALYLAEGAIEVAKTGLADAIANFDVAPLTGTVEVGGVDVEWIGVESGFDVVTTDASGIQTQITGYELSATAEVRGVRETVHQLVNVERTPIFQFAVFYDNDLEIFPGPNMTLGGRVHTNADVYLGSGATLTIDTNYLRASGNLYRSRKDDPSKSEGTVKIRNWVANPFDPSEPSVFTTLKSKSQLAADGVPSATGYDSNFGGHDGNGDGDFLDFTDVLPWGPGSLELWEEPTAYPQSGHTVLTGEHGLTDATPPGLGSIEMFSEQAGGDYVWSGASGTYVPVAPGSGTHSKGYFHANADLVVVTKANGTWQAFDGDGFDVTSSVAAAGVVTIKSIYDARQAAGSSTKVQVTEIDVEKLNASGLFPANGLLYAASYGAGTGTSTKGVKLKNGSELLAPLTVVSENPVYVQGDYNTVDKKGAAVICDAINLLSNSWNDAKSKGSLPTASATTYNLAFITGNHDTVGSAYNGGLENLPRFHENWSGKECEINGSFVNLWNSKYATGKWAYGGDRYTAPNRVWAYDTDFNDITKLPPFTPMVVTAQPVAIW